MKLLSVLEQLIDIITIYIAKTYDRNIILSVDFCILKVIGALVLELNLTLFLQWLVNGLLQ